MVVQPAVVPKADQAGFVNVVVPDPLVRLSRHRPAMPKALPGQATNP
jgi:hypothetical protein